MLATGVWVSISEGGLGLPAMGPADLEKRGAVTAGDAQHLPLDCPACPRFCVIGGGSKERDPCPHSIRPLGTELCSPLNMWGLGSRLISKIVTLVLQLSYCHILKVMKLDIVSKPSFAEAGITLNSP